MVFDITRQLNWLHELYQLGRSDMIKESPEQVLKRILRHIVEGFKAESGSLALCQGNDCDRLTIVAGLGLPKECIGSTIPRRTGIIGWVMEENQPLLLNGDVSDDPRFRGKVPKSDTSLPTFSMCWPLTLEDRPIGVLCVNTMDEKSTYTAEDLEHGRVLVNLIALVVDNIRLHAEKQQRIGELQEACNKLQQTQDQLIQSEKMASIGQLAAGVAHEINNPIGYVSSNLGVLGNYVADLLALAEAYEDIESGFSGAPEQLERISAFKQKIDLDFLKSDVLSLLEESREGTTRVKKIVQDLKDFSHAGAEDEWQWANLHEGLESTLNIVHNEIKYKAQVIKEFGEIPNIQCLPFQLKQVFMNLLVNAAHAIESEGTITVKTRADNDKVWVEIADTGKGIAPEHLHKIFDPFFTTKPVGKGTGLGLSVSYSILQKHKGEILVESEPGHGTTFRIALPVRQAEA